MSAKISDLPAAGAITGAELIELTQGGVSVRSTVGATGATSAMQGFYGNYAGGVPTDTPTSATAKAFDTSDGTEWSWYNGSWLH